MDVLKIAFQVCEEANRRLGRWGIEERIKASTHELWTSVSGKSIADVAFYFMHNRVGAFFRKTKEVVVRCSTQEIRGDPDADKVWVGLLSYAPVPITFFLAVSAFLFYACHLSEIQIYDIGFEAYPNFTRIFIPLPGCRVKLVIVITHNQSPPQAELNIALDLESWTSKQGMVDEIFAEAVQALKRHSAIALLK